MASRSYLSRQAAGKSARLKVTIWAALQRIAAAATCRSLLSGRSVRLASRTSKPVTRQSSTAWSICLRIPLSCSTGDAACSVDRHHPLVVNRLAPPRPENPRLSEIEDQAAQPDPDQHV